MMTIACSHGFSENGDYIYIEKIQPEVLLHLVIVTFIVICSLIINFIPIYYLVAPASVSRMRVRLVIRRLWVRPPPGQQPSFVELDYEISSTVTLPCFWQMNVHNTCIPLRVQSSSTKSAVRLTDSARHDPSGLTGRTTATQTNKLSSCKKTDLY